MKTIVSKLLVTSVVATLATMALPAAAFAATHTVTCTNHNTQAAVSSGSGAIICFAGTGSDWEGYIRDVASIWSGPYSVVAGQNGTDNPIEIPPRTTYRLPTRMYIQFVQLI
jgi:hypothetical protein